MSAPPVILYSRPFNATEVLCLLQAAGPVALTGEDYSWSSARLQLGEAELTVNHDEDYYAGSEWPRQRAGMAGYFAEQGAAPDVLRAIAGFGFALSVPGAPHPASPDDPAAQVLRRLAELTDGALFVEDRLLDGAGRLLAGPGGARDRDARAPAQQRPAGWRGAR